jgi:pilus assembly protein CpaF
LVEQRAVQSELTRIKTELHRKVLEEIDLEQLDRARRDTALQETRRLIRTTLERENHPLTSTERDRMVQELLDELFGLGPLEPLLSDGSISDILVNGYGSVYIERKGKLEKTAIQFNDDEHLKRIIDRIVSRVGRRVDESSPMVDARLPDGSRVNAIIPPLSLGGPTLSIRRFGLDPLRASDLLANETLTPAMLELLQSAVKAKLNILISGGTGAGKTTLLNVLSAAIPEGERIISIEDAAELQLL